ncbi:hypothetical protein CLAFUW4_13440 [Fulvia fulva]|uniref:Myb-like domain-containing protein n=1 Tax=Passalora fulva TaxID=5499 RepID=A0A9Q8PKI4_PASFU|nr:uncharacterized protein CLAFUR5_13294 [Fulvia fulva]KAK4611842.1 hypothetical protein CLAFUR4_13443 [Fulvia fulva]KAK4612958.1 hypothetical protein CLAFUR0_13451 [Fulvia fulva]UJO24097.1 hypothetical protein CLAFUR5_13294 [Fulvia fulva]WPV20999.1 hypothetical protein CLAFUW4_13440 [Fulvia fulva]WPV35768.1 hypothetical protein CLAFUW7_13447 [Fulvia fulva]
MAFEDLPVYQPPASITAKTIKQPFGALMPVTTPKSNSTPSTQPRDRNLKLIDRMEEAQGKYRGVNAILEAASAIDARESNARFSPLKNDPSPSFGNPRVPASDPYHGIDLLLKAAGMLEARERQEAAKRQEAAERQKAFERLKAADSWEGPAAPVVEKQVAKKNKGAKKGKRQPKQGREAPSMWDVEDQQEETEPLKKDPLLKEAPWELVFHVQPEVQANAKPADGTMRQDTPMSDYQPPEATTQDLSSPSSSSSTVAASENQSQRSRSTKSGSVATSAPSKKRKTGVGKQTASSPKKPRTGSAASRKWTEEEEEEELIGLRNPARAGGAVPYKQVARILNRGSTTACRIRLHYLMVNGRLPWTQDEEQKAVRQESDEGRR